MRHYLLLLEIDRLTHMLVEDRMDFLRKSYVPKLVYFLTHSWTNQLEQVLGDVVQLPSQLDADAASMVAGVIIEKIVEADPSPQKRNTQWMLNLFLKGKLPLEDLGKASEYLTVFERVKPHLPVELRDLNRYKSIQNLFDTIEPYQQEQSQRELSRSEDAEMHGQAKVLYNDSHYKVLIPLTKEASCYFGKNTQWCTAATSSWNAFEHYNSQGPMYIILDKENNRRWQWHPASAQFMDERDHPVPLITFVADNPEIAKLFIKLDGEPVAHLKWDPKQDPAPVYQTETGYVAKTQPGLLGKPVLNILMKEGAVHRISQPHWVPSGYIARLLNQLKLPGDPKGGPITGENDELFYRNGSWGYPDGVGADVMRFPDGHVWREVRYRQRKMADHGDHDKGVIIVRHLALVAPGQRKRVAHYESGVLCEAKITGDVFKIAEAETKVAEFAPYVVDYLLQQHVAKVWDRQSAIGLDAFPKEQAERLLKAKPSFGSFEVMFNLYGVTPDTKRLLLKELKDRDIEHPNRWIGKDRLIVHIWPNITDCIEEVGNKAARWYCQLNEGEDHLEIYDVETDANTEQELLQTLEPDVLHKLGVWLAEQEPDELDYLDDEYDPTDWRSIHELYRESRNRDLKSAFHAAHTDALEVGGQNEAYKLLVDAIKLADLVFLKNKKWTDKVTWDVPVAKAIPMERMASEDKLDEIQDQGWDVALQVEIRADEPYYGLDGYDEEAAKERFDDEIDQLIATDTGA